MAGSILYPPAPPSSRPLFYLPHNGPTHYPDGSRIISNGAATSGASGLSSVAVQEKIREEYKSRGNDIDSEEEDGVGILRRYQEQRTAQSTTQRGFVNGGSQTDITKYPLPPTMLPTASSVDSIDGYDSFENTNNKKKRKIPTSGTLGNHHSSLSAEMAQMGIHASLDSFDSAQDGEGGVSQYYGSGNSAIPAASSGTGISGAGRGRFGRSGVRNSAGRSPLGISLNGSNALGSSRNPVLRRDLPLSDSSAGKGNTNPVVLMVFGRLNLLI